MCGFSLITDGGDLRGVGHLDIQPGPHHLAQLPDVAVLDVPSVLPQVGRDSVRPGGLASHGPGHRVGLAAPQSAVTRLAERGNMININTQLQHTFEVWPTSPFLGNRY